MQRGRRLCGGLGVLAIVLTAGAAGCNAEPAVPGAAPLELIWTEVALPHDLTPVTLAISGTSVLVGARAQQRPVPRLLAGPSPTDLQELPLMPRSPYAFEATWLAVATRGRQIVAVSGARGGAHANYRWSTWSGTADGVAEQEQPFGVFGGYGAGDLVGVAFAGDSPVILGSWQSEGTGLDITTWLRTGERWNRQPATGTALASTPAELLSATAIASTGDVDADGGDDGLVLSGSVTRLGQGSVRVDPAVWVAPAASGPWQRVDLPGLTGSAVSEAHATSCRPAGCTVVGASAGRLVVWRLEGTKAIQRGAVPVVTLADCGRALPPVHLSAHEVVLAPGDDRTVVVQFSGERGEDWAVQDGPRGTPVSAVVHDNDVLLVTRDAAGVGHLWRGDH